MFIICVTKFLFLFYIILTCSEGKGNVCVYVRKKIVDTLFHDIVTWADCSLHCASTWNCQFHQMVPELEYNC